MRKHRGLAPEDRLFFDKSRFARLKRAVEDLSWLLRRGYAQKAAVELVGNRYQLTRRERHALIHAAWGGENRRRPVSADELAGRTLCIDGFNLLITLETALGGGILIRGQDGCYRDIANVHGNYTLRMETEEAIKLAAEAIKTLKVKEALWYFDRPVSNSGRIAKLVNEIAGRYGAAMRAKTSDRVDSLLKACGDVVVTADAVILDSGVAWFDLAGWIIGHEIDKPLNLLDFSSVQ
ncbi:DUF434 domain-containing protein [Hydrogenimonas urashimensis]|uniref:DUF434 domain-containing protein n=1 Tax=Hydrogenimonas urashimensis TaxID=2740515 RepID=UPI0019153078|nr:DUF434 domain-containing protein [Hydrogenimonas urashimensis]